MEKGSIVERDYSISNMSLYENVDFLKKLDEISKSEGITILKRILDKKNDAVKITARFDTDHWDVCQSVNFLSNSGILVEPISDYRYLTEDTTKKNLEKCQSTLRKVKGILRKA